MRVKLLFVGDGSYPMYARALYNAAQDMDGVIADIIDYGMMNIKAIPQRDVFKRGEYHYCFGPDINSLNRELLKKCQNINYDIVFLYSAELIYESTIKKLKKLGIYIATYHNDNPFSKERSKFRLRHFIGTIKYSDISYAYRQANVNDYLKYGSQRAKVLRSYYIRSRNYYIPDESLNLYTEIPRIGFIGHYEDDGRIEYVKALIDKGVDVGVIDDWPVINEHMIVIKDAHMHYNEILNKLDIAIVFLSTLNEDTYTRRCFEIPMAKTMMLSIYTDDIASMYEEGKEIVFFRNKEEFVEKSMYYLDHDKERIDIANAGYDRCLSDGNEAADRVREIIEDYEAL